MPAWFRRRLWGDVYNIVLNEAAVRTLGFASADAAIGERLSVETVDQPMKIIGVVKDYHQQSLNKGYTPILFALHDKLSWMKQRYISVVMENANPRELVKLAETVWNRYFPIPATITSSSTSSSTSNTGRMRCSG